LPEILLGLHLPGSGGTARTGADSRRWMPWADEMLTGKNTNDRKALSLGL